MFLPPQLLWWLGPHSLAARWAHPLIVAIALAVVLAWYSQRRARNQPTVPSSQDALLILSLVFLLRAALDPLNNVYYAIPFLFVLLTYEVRAGRAPLLMLLCATLMWVPPQLPYSVSASLRAGVYAAVAVPVIAALVLRLFLPETTQALLAWVTPRRIGQRLSLLRGRAPA
jgi:hypothetical protein